MVLLHLVLFISVYRSHSIALVIDGRPFTWVSHKATTISFDKRPLIFLASKIYWIATVTVA